MKPTLPAVAGNEGVAVVKAVGSNVSTIKVGDWVIPNKAGFGTWREEAVSNEKDFLKIRNDIPVAYAASIAVNPCTAYRMLRDFTTLKAGDYIIQNGSNGQVGMAIIQMAKLMDVKTINIVRSDRPDVDNELDLLTRLGGDINIPDTYVNTHEFREILADLPPIKLGFNCIGGDVVTNMARVMGTGSTLVTYGGMSKRPITVSYETLAYKQMNLKGFWISAWNDANINTSKRSEMLSDISDMIKNQDLKLFFDLHDFDDFDHAIQVSMEPFRLRKTVLNMDYPDRFKEHDARMADEKQSKFFKSPVV